MTQQNSNSLNNLYWSMNNGSITPGTDRADLLKPTLLLGNTEKAQSSARVFLSKLADLDTFVCIILLRKTTTTTTVETEKT